LGKNGLTLDYDIGGLAGNYATGKLNPFDWRKHDDNHGVPFDYALNRSGKKECLVVSFPQEGPANFVAELNEPEDVDRILTVLRTLKPIGGESDIKPREALTNCNITRLAANTVYPLRRFADAARRTRLPLAATSSMT
jgi:hypothetical protein